MVEQHAAARLAWLRQQSADSAPIDASTTNRLIFIAYNVIRWIPIVLAFIKLIDYRVAFFAFFRDYSHASHCQHLPEQFPFTREG